MRKGAFELGFKEIVIATLAIVILLIIVILFIMISKPAVEIGNIWGRRAAG